MVRAAIGGNKWRHGVVPSSGQPAGDRRIEAGERVARGVGYLYWAASYPVLEGGVAV